MKNKKKWFKKIDPIDAIMWFVGISLFIPLMSLSVRSCNMGTNPDDYTTICIKGHLYYNVNFGQKMAVTIVLDDEGRPVKCQN